LLVRTPSLLAAARVAPSARAHGAARCVPACAVYWRGIRFLPPAYVGCPGEGGHPVRSDPHRPSVLARAGPKNAGGCAPRSARARCAWLHARAPLDVFLVHYMTVPKGDYTKLEVKLGGGRRRNKKAGSAAGQAKAAAAGGGGKAKASGGRKSSA
jgi:hypothetical protein